MIQALMLDASIDDEFEIGTGPKRFTHKELSQATNGFAEEGKLGEGGSGGVYKGFLGNLRLEVAVKDECIDPQEIFRADFHIFSYKSKTL